MSFWSLHLGVLCCIMVRVVQPIPHNNTLNSQIPESYLKLAEGNSLWYNLLRNCRNSSSTCIQRTAYDYLDDLLDYPEDIQVTSNVLLEKNDINYASISKESDNAVEEEDIQRSSSLDEVTGALHGKAIKFLMTHDLVVKLPEYFFDGAFLKVSPRTFDADGALVKLNTFPGKGRIFFKKISEYTYSRNLLSKIDLLTVVYDVRNFSNLFNRTKRLRHLKIFVKSHLIAHALMH